jgi:hypothetical protein
LKQLSEEELRRLKRKAERIQQMSQEPVSAASLATALFAAGEAAFVATAAQTAVAAALLTTAQIAATAAISIGLTYASQALFNQSGSDSIGSAGTVNPAVAKISTRQSAPPKRIPYGTVHCGGALLFEEVKPPYLYRMYAVSAREINAFKKIYIGTREVPFSSLTPGVILAPKHVPENPPFHTRLQVSVRHGTAAQTICPLLAAAFPNLASTFRQQGIATVTLQYHFGSSTDERQALWGIYGDPQPFFLIEGVKVYDPRDSAQDRDDATTWEFSNNATLCQTDYLRAEYGGRIKAERIDWDKTAISANYDDETIGCANGEFVRRHTVDGLILLNQSPADVLGGMLASNRSAIAMSGRKVWVSSSKPKDPVATIYDGIIAGGIEYQADKPKRDLVNTVQTRFVAPEREYNLTDGPILVDDDAVTEDGESLTATLQFPFVNDHRKVQRLQKAFKNTSRKGRKISVPVDLRILAEATDDLVDNPVHVSSDLFPQCNVIYNVNQYTLSDNFTTLTLDCSEYDKSIENDWTPSTDEQAFTVASLDVS